MKNTVLLSLFFFFAGFLIHALIFPDFLSRTGGFDSFKNKVLLQGETKQVDNLLTIVSFKDGSFHPSKVWIGKGDYVGIQNDDEDLRMWLASEIPLLSTVRGYGVSERVTSIVDSLGTFVVFNKQDLSKSLTIVVGPN